MNYVKHGGSGTKLYGVWQAMKDRCLNSKSRMFPLYGRRGITVCPEWCGRRGFVVFRDWALANGYSEGLDLDREDNDGNYEPANCRWVTHQVNSRNRRDTRWATAFGETKRLVEWVEDSRCVVSKSVVYDRLRAGKTFEEAISTPRSTAHGAERCSMGHARTPDNLLAGGQCRTCHREWQREHRRKKALS